VAPRVILTAAHCAEDTSTGVARDPSGYRVVTGSVNRDSLARQISAVSQVIVYPGFDPGDLHQDAALLVLTTPTTAPPITLATAENSVNILPGDEYTMAGWGSTYYGQTKGVKQLRWAYIVHQSPEACASYIHANYDQSSEICVLRPPSHDTTICEGDSGGPLLGPDARGIGTIEIGIASRSSNTCSAEVPVSYIRVDAVSSWIQEQAKAIASAPHPTRRPSFVDLPGRYVTSGSSQSTRIAIHVSSDGRHVDGLRLTANFSCGMHYSFFVTPSQRGGWLISNRIAAAAIAIYPSRYWRSGKLWLHLQFDELGEVDGRVSARLRSRRGNALCRINDVNFTASPFS
jgi:hypothetical protein